MNEIFSPIFTVKIGRSSAVNSSFLALHFDFIFVDSHLSFSKIQRH